MVQLEAVGTTLDTLFFQAQAQTVAVVQRSRDGHRRKLQTEKTHTAVEVATCATIERCTTNFSEVPHFGSDQPL